MKLQLHHINLSTDKVDEMNEFYFAWLASEHSVYFFGGFTIVLYCKHVFTCRQSILFSEFSAQLNNLHSALKTLHSALQTLHSAPPLHRPRHLPRQPCACSPRPEFARDARRRRRRRAGADAADHCHVPRGMHRDDDHLRRGAPDPARSRVRRVPAAPLARGRPLRPRVRAARPADAHLRDSGHRRLVLRAAQRGGAAAAGHGAAAAGHVGALGGAHRGVAERERGGRERDEGGE